jgi:hypothetical protein
MWDIIKEELGEQQTTPRNIELKVHGATIQDPTAVANVFNEYYANTARHILSGNPSSNNNEDNVNTIKYNSSSMFLIPTTEIQVADIIKGMDNKKSMVVG